MENKPFFKKVIVSKKKEVGKKNAFIKQEEEVYILESIGQTCQEFLKDFIGKEVKVQAVSAIKVKDEDEREYFIIDENSLVSY